MKTRLEWIRSRCLLALIAMAIGVAQSSLVVATERLPALQVESLAGNRLTVPTGLEGDVQVYIIGFSRESTVRTEAWTRKIVKVYGATGVPAVHQVAVLWDVPRVFRGFVLKGIKRSVPVKMHARFLVATDRFDDWKRIARYAHPDSAYIVLVDSRNEIAWRQAGEFSEASFQALADRLRSLDIGR